MHACSPNKVVSGSGGPDSFKRLKSASTNTAFNLVLLIILSDCDPSPRVSQSTEPQSIW